MPMHNFTQRCTYKRLDEYKIFFVQTFILLDVSHTFSTVHKNLLYHMLVYGPQYFELNEQVLIILKANSYYNSVILFSKKIQVSSLTYNDMHLFYIALFTLYHNFKTEIFINCLSTNGCPSLF